MRRSLVWVSLFLAGLVLIGIALQLYFIAAYVFGAGKGALDAHKNFGGIVHLSEVLVFLVSLGAWWRNWRNVGQSFLLPLVGTVQVFLAGDISKGTNGWLHGLHGGLVLLVVWVAWSILKRDLRATRVSRSASTV
jgi:hypothetical protein